MICEYVDMIKPKEYSLERLSAELDHILRQETGPRQVEIAKIAAVDQSYVSRAANRRLRRMTRRARRLATVVAKIYANMQKRKIETPKGIDDAVRSYLALGGDPELLMLQLQVLEKAIRPIRRSEPVKA
jgi:hypothetical protein